MRLTMSPLALIALVPASAFAVNYLSPEQAAQLMFPDADRFDAQSLLPAGSSRPLGVRVAKKGEAVLGYVVLDEVIGKVELISYAVGIANDGSIKQVEILAYRESHGSEIRLPAWRQQFAGKTVQAPIQVGSDIANISGATLSCTHVTEGIKRIAAVIEIARASKQIGA